MTVNPFETEIGVKTSNPFADQAFAAADSDARDKMFKEGETLVSASERFRTTAEVMRNSKLSFVRTWIWDYGRVILRNLLEFAKRAIQLAIFKFVLEMCAQILKNIMDAMTAKGFSAMDISTKGISYSGDGAARPTNTTFNANPFGSPFSHSGFSNPWN